MQWGLNYLLRATQATAPSSPDRGPRLQFLAETLLQAVEIMQPGEGIGVVTSHLNNARGWLQESLELAGPERRATCRSSLGTALLLRVSYLGESDELPSALNQLRRACDEPAGRAVRAACYGNYAKGLWRRYKLDGSQEALNDAVAAFRRALELSPADDPDRLAHTRNLISALEGAGHDAEADEVRRALG
jgi:hypothetical protein